MASKAEVVGQVDLSKQAFELEKRIGHEIKSSWLDGGTAFGFRKELESKAATGDVRQLESLLRRVVREIQWRKEQFEYRVGHV